MKPKLLILSDIFGGENPEWIKKYVNLLSHKFEVQYYDVCKLANIDSENISETDLHNQFLNGGIDKAITNLSKLEKDEVYVLGFSIGGTIAWKAALKSFKINFLFAVSSTRLRLENEAPRCNLQLYFGENDFNNPDSEWFLKLKVPAQFLSNQEHQLYLQDDMIFLVCNDILKTVEKIK